jgi:Pvc16 N-terminal domain
MADYRAVAAVSEAIIYLLESHYTPEDFDGNQLQFKVYLAKDFAQPMDAGVSFFLYRIYTNGTHRAPSGRTTPEGQRYRTQLAVDVHFLLTAWAKDASLQHTIAGWMMRIMEDTPSLPTGLLNHKIPNVFHLDETVEVSLTELTTEELFRIWEVIVNNAYQISVPYVARNVKIESRLLLSTAQPLQERIFDLGKLEIPPAGQS